METETTPKIFDMPVELCDEITSYLKYVDLLNFRQTCGTAHFLVGMDQVAKARSELRAELLQEEQDEYDKAQERYANHERWARTIFNNNRTYWSSDSIANLHANSITKARRLNCYACLKTLPRECFTEQQCRGSRSLGHKDAGHRFCKACGVAKGIWKRGTILKEAGGALVVCKGCGRLAKPGDMDLKRARVCSDECLQASAAVVAAAPHVPETGLQPDGENAQQQPLPVEESSTTSTGPAGVERQEDSLTTSSTTTTFTPLATLSTLTTLTTLGSHDNQDNIITGNVNNDATDDVYKYTSGAAKTTRATRCLRCWATSHTERLADGHKGLRLCKRCEESSITTTTAATPPPLTVSAPRAQNNGGGDQDDSRSIGRLMAFVSLAALVVWWRSFERARV